MVGLGPSCAPSTKIMTRGHGVLGWSGPAPFYKFGQGAMRLAGEE